MKVQPLELKGLLLIELAVHGDERGFFVERFNERSFKELGLPTHFVQDNHSRTEPGFVRGLHAQYDPGQGKLVGCLRGRIFDVAVDVRPESPTYGKHVSVELGGEPKTGIGRLLWIPAGFAHGFCVIGNEQADVMYKVDAFYTAATERGIRWDDPELGIRWPVSQAKVSARDAALPSFAEYRRNPPVFKPSSFLPR